MAKIPDRIDIDKADRYFYDHDVLKSELFENRTRKEQFLFAMAYGFKNKVNRHLDTKEGFFLAKDMRPEDETMIDLVASYNAGFVDVLSDREKVFSIAEEYAHAGIKLLYDEVTSGQPGSFLKKLELELFRLFESPNLE